jgi:hypothetical protein
MEEPVKRRRSFREVWEEISGLSNAAIGTILVAVMTFQYLVDKFVWFSFLTLLAGVLYILAWVMAKVISCAAARTRGD